jgi:putative transcription factor
MVQCELCGAETSTPTTAKVEGAELEVCDDCAELGTEVRKPDESTTSTKYSTSSDDGSSPDSTATTRTSSGGGGGGRKRGSEMYDDVDELAQDYDDRIRGARESAGLSQEDLADDLNEKASLIRKLERGDMLPSDDVQSKLERALDISLSAEGGDDTADWEADASSGEYTLGDMVERKD